MTSRSEILLDSKLALRDGLQNSRSGVSFDAKGYVVNWRDNLIDGALSPELEQDFRRGKGNELEGKFCAPHSSAALAANAFGAFRNGNSTFSVPRLGDLALLQFEKTMPTGLAGRTPPHLDALADARGMPVGIESKCLEYLSKKVATFSDEYLNLAKCRGTRWFAEMERLRTNPRDYACLDAAQLIKHAFGMTNVVAGQAILLYVYWEPLDAEHHELFALHRAEIKRFAANVAGDAIQFEALSYPEIWNFWTASTEPALQSHGTMLAKRYGGKLGSYEGYIRVDGRKSDVSLHDDD